MVSSNSRPAEVIWNYDRVELIADGIVHAIGVSLGLAGAIAIVVVAANSQHNTELSIHRSLLCRLAVDVRFLGRLQHMAGFAREADSAAL